MFEIFAFEPQWVVVASPPLQSWNVFLGPNGDVLTVLSTLKRGPCCKHTLCILINVQGGSPKSSLFDLCYACILKFPCAGHRMCVFRFVPSWWQHAKIIWNPQDLSNSAGLPKVGMSTGSPCHTQSKTLLQRLASRPLSSSIGMPSSS